MSASLRVVLSMVRVRPTVARTLRHLLFVSAAVFLFPAFSWAHTVVVRGGGGADATTIQGGLDLILAVPSAGEPESLIVLPGNYDESVLFDLGRISEQIGSLAVVGPGGFSRTRVRGITVGGDPGYAGSVQFSGFSIAERVSDGPLAHFTLWTHCRFERGYDAIASGDYIHSYEGCEFHGRVLMHGFVGNPYTDVCMHDCRFVGATFDFGDDAAGDVAIRSCTFEGPADTALIAHISASNEMWIVGCRFSGFRYGIVQAAPASGTYGPAVKGCTFQGIAEDAIRYSSDYVYRERDYYNPNDLRVSDSRFRNCGSAIRWHILAPSRVELTADTIECCRGTAVIADVGPCRLDSLLVSGSGGGGVLLTARSADPNIPLQLPIDVRASGFLDNAGSGLVVRDTLVSPYDPGHIQITDCAFTGNGGDGLACQGERLLIVRDLAHGNRGAGFVLGPTGPFPTRIAQNSSVLNRSDGFRIESFQAQAGIAFENNLSAFNDGRGLVAAPAVSGAALHNDLWPNRPPIALSGDNLNLDPGLCDALAGDDHVQSASPCAASGPFGQIGVFGVGCDASKILIELSDGRWEGHHLDGIDETSAVRGHDGMSGSDDDHGDDHPHDHEPTHVTAAVFGTRVLNVSTLVPLTARLGLTGAGPAQGSSTMDVNHDGRPDLVLLFDAKAIGDPSSDGTLPLTISTTSGLAERGLDRAPGSVLAEGGGPRRERHLNALNKGLEFALSSARFEPGSQHARVDFTVPAPSAGTAELFDVTGRRVARSEWSAAQPGAQSIELAPQQELATGIYLVRVIRNGVAQNARLTVLH